jgi:hypothetical protein
MVYELVTEAIHSPRLGVLQAALLYIHQQPRDEARHKTADTPFLWSFVGQIVGLACSLGLHIECRMWGIPAWEKRLRRRLWWAVYAEDKWRSLLMGRPPYIHPAEWDVSDLDEGDFLVGHRIICVNLAVTTRSVLLPARDSGNPRMKSIVMGASCSASFERVLSHWIETPATWRRSSSKLRCGERKVRLSAARQKKARAVGDNEGACACCRCFPT